MVSQILNHCFAIARDKNKPIRLSYLQGNQVEGLYTRFGFEKTGHDRHFVHMQMCPTAKQLATS
ncbi:hypothetical protein ACODM8_10130 [Vibrio ostreicida]|uniref:hypothetical protein n=1 Tax=Vibrio ostreicida TaxID=526588 RepID=UPI003B59644C